MKQNSRLSVALHVLAHLAAAPAQYATSEHLSACIHTNPVVIRRTLAGLREAAIVVSVKGHGGGWLLARAPEQISLQDVYLALGEPAMRRVRQTAAGGGCLLEAAVGRVLDDSFRDAEALFVARLSTISLAQLTADFLQALATHREHRHG